MPRPEFAFGVNFSSKKRFGYPGTRAAFFDTLSRCGDFLQASREMPLDPNFPYAEVKQSIRLASRRAKDVTIRPTFKKVQALTCRFSRRRAMSQRIVANDPVTERLGPRSIPMSIAFATCPD